MSENIWIFFLGDYYLLFLCLILVFMIFLEIYSNSTANEVEGRKEEKFEIDLMVSEKITFSESISFFLLVFLTGFNSDVRRRRRKLNRRRN